MTGLETAQKVKIELNKLDSSNYTDVRIEKVLHYINKASLFLVKKKGQPYGPGKLEAMHPALDDLKVLLKEISVDSISSSEDEVVVPFEANMLYFIPPCRVKTSTNTCTAAWQEGRFVRPERVYKELQSPFNKTRLDDPVFTVSDNQLVIYTDSFTVDSVKYKYIQMPDTVGQTDTIVLPFVDEIIDTAVTMMLDNFESERLKTQAAVSVAKISE